jgi:hypothetical protein
VEWFRWSTASARLPPSAGPLFADRRQRRLLVSVRGVGGRDGDDAQLRDAQVEGGVAGLLDGLIGALAEDGEHHAQEQAAEKAQRGVHRKARLVGRFRRLGRIHHPDVGGAQRPRDARFLDPLQHAVVDLAVGIHLALQQVVVGDVIRLAGDQVGHRGVIRRQEAFAAAGGFVVVADAAQDVGALAVEIALQRSDLVLHLLHPGVGGGVGGRKLRHLPAVIAELALDVFQVAVVEHLADGIGGGVGGQLIAGLAADALGLGLGELFLKGLELRLGKVVLFLREEQLLAGGVGLQGVFGFLQLDPDVFHLVGQPFARVLGALPAGFQVLIR